MVLKEYEKKIEKHNWIAAITLDAYLREWFKRKFKDKVKGLNGIAVELWDKEKYKHISGGLDIGVKCLISDGSLVKEKIVDLDKFVMGLVFYQDKSGIDRRFTEIDARRLEWKDKRDIVQYMGSERSFSQLGKEEASVLLKTFGGDLIRTDRELYKLNKVKKGVADWGDVQKHIRENLEEREISKISLLRKEQIVGLVNVLLRGARNNLFGILRMTFEKLLEFHLERKYGMTLGGVELSELDKRDLKNLVEYFSLEETIGYLKRIEYFGI